MMFTYKKFPSDFIVIEDRALASLLNETDDSLQAAGADSSPPKQELTHSQAEGLLSQLLTAQQIQTLRALNQSALAPAEVRPPDGENKGKRKAVKPSCVLEIQQTLTKVSNTL